MSWKEKLAPVHFSFMFSILFFPRIAIASFRPFALGWGVNKRTVVSIAAIRRGRIFLRSANRLSPCSPHET